jgi:hypothetical protein
MVVNGANNIVGRAVVVHAKEDNCTMPCKSHFSFLSNIFLAAAGRIAFCVIGVSTGAYTTVSVPAATPLTQDTTQCLALTSTTSATGASATTGENSATSSVASFAVIAFLLALLF